jgi:hypothetical protein
MFGFISRTEASVLVLVLAIFSFFFVGSVPTATLAEHAFAYVAMSVFLAQFATLAFVAVVELAIIPVANRFYDWLHADCRCGRQHTR